MSTAACEILIATSPKDKKPSTLEHLSTGFIAGTLARTITSPLDVLKMLMQVSAKGGSVSSEAKKLWKESGIAGFWRGNVAACVRLGPQSAIKFYAFDELQNKFGNGKPLLGWKRTVCGSSAGVISQVLTYPLDVIRTRITVDPKKYTGIFSGLLTILKEEGFGALYGGIVPTVMGVIPYEGAQFYAQGALKNLYQTKIAPGKPLTPFTNCMIGACAGIFSQTFSYPFDVVRKRLMLVDKATGKPLYSGMIDCFTKLVAAEGPLALYKGFGLNCVKGVPFAALQFTLLDETKKAFARFHAKYDNDIKKAQDKVAKDIKKKKGK